MEGSTLGDAPEALSHTHMYSNTHVHLQAYIPSHTLKKWKWDWKYSLTVKNSLESASPVLELQASTTMLDSLCGWSRQDSVPHDCAASILQTCYLSSPPGAEFLEGPLCPIYLPFP